MERLAHKDHRATLVPMVSMVQWVLRDQPVPSAHRVHKGHRAYLASTGMTAP
jgi:hypothetical protein